MQHPVLTEVLKFARDDAGLRQSALAVRMETVPSVVSRIERLGRADPDLANRYLRAVGTPLAAKIIEFYDRSWKKTPPSFLHPDREILWQIEKALQELEAFEQSPQNRPILRTPIAILRDNLNAGYEYLERRDHTVAWVGDIGVGKTTALAFATRILISDAKGNSKPVFPVGSGRVTVCETIVRSAPAFGVGVEPLSEEEMRDIVRNLVVGLRTSQGGISAEINRVVRNMSALRVTRTINESEEFEIHDPILDLLDHDPDDDHVVDAIIEKMNLASRKETQVLLSGDAEDGMAWLARTISQVNNGQDARFSAPRKITVFLPTSVLDQRGQELSVVDTRGIDAITQRPDLRSYMDDPRTLVVLCSKFADAPGPTPQKLLKENDEAGSNAAELQRLCLLVLPRGDEALSVMDQGDPPSSRLEGYDIRRQDIRRSLAASKLPALPVLFFDALKDPPDRVWRALGESVATMRLVHAERVNRAIAGVADLITNVDVIKTKRARLEVQEDIDRLIARIRKLPIVRKPAYLNLIAQLEEGHHSSIAASVVRRGGWYNFPITHILGVGVRKDANLRSQDFIVKIQNLLEEQKSKHAELPDVVSSIESIEERLSEWRQEFLSSALSIGTDGFRTLVEEEDELWELCANRYGQGIGYKKDIAAAWAEYFGSTAPGEALAKIDSRLARSWRQLVLAPLTAATRAEE